MKKLRRITSFVLITMLFALSISAYANTPAGSDVEITFSIGEDTLLINGEAKTVEKPYAVGVGVTLVPLRVITEAFGAEVTWIGETQSVTLKYPGVDILLQIGNPIAEVNGKAETLLAPPEISGSTTMVPLRFISESFGALVSYDNATGKITVVKKSQANSGTIIESTIDMLKIGDSYYNWSMEKPSDMQMSEREFDGTYTLFEYDEENWIEIIIYEKEDNFDFEREYTTVKNDIQGYTLIKADKNTSDAKLKTMHFQYKDKDSFFDDRFYVTDKYFYNVYSGFTTENEEIKKKSLEIIDTFTCSFSKEDTHDLSNVKNGYRTFESETLNYTIDVPHNYYMANYADVENEISFYAMDEDDSSSIDIAIYSRSDVGSAKEIAESDYVNNKAYTAENVSKFSSEVYETEYQNFSAWEYWMEVDCTSAKLYARDVFFELGEYVYNVCVKTELSNTSREQIINYILNSITLKKIDSSQVGIMLRNAPKGNETYEVAEGDWKMVLPDNYIADYAYDEGASITHYQGIVYIEFSATKNVKASMVSLRKDLKMVEDMYKEMPDMKIIIPTRSVKIGNVEYLELLATDTNNEENMKQYIQIYVTCLNGKEVAFVVGVDEATYSERVKEDIAKIVSSLTIK